MSAMTATLQRDRVTVLTDAAFYDATGILTDLRPKCWAVPGVSDGVFASRGVFLAYIAFAEAAGHSGATSFDELVSRLDSIWRRFDADMARRGRGHSAQILIAGWSKARGRPEVLFRSLHDQYGLAARTTYVFLAGHVSFGVELKGDPETFDPGRDGVAAFETARAAPCDLTCGEGLEPVMGHSIGGWIDATTTTDAGVDRRQLHRWPDQVGHVIQPAMRQAAA